MPDLIRQLLGKLMLGPVLLDLDPSYLMLLIDDLL
jgi:hypothetical protein